MFQSEFCIVSYVTGGQQVCQAQFIRLSRARLLEYLLLPLPVPPSTLPLVAVRLINTFCACCTSLEASWLVSLIRIEADADAAAEALCGMWHVACGMFHYFGQCFSGTWHTASTPASPAAATAPLLHPSPAFLCHCLRLPFVFIDVNVK